MLPFLFSLGLPALAPTLGITGMSGAALAGVGAGLGSFLETGDVGKGIKTGLTSFLGGKILSGMGGAAAAKTPVGVELGGVNPATVSQEAFADALAKVPAENTGFLQTTLTDTLGEKAAAGLMQPGVLNTAFLGQTAADLYNPPEFESQEKEANPPPDPLPPIRTARFRDRDEDDSSSEFNYFDYYRPERGYDPNYPYLYNKGGAVQKMRGGGIMGLTMNNPMAGLQNSLMAAINNNAQSKVGPFVQKVENDARAEFGDEIFQPQQKFLRQDQEIGGSNYLAALEQARLGGMGSNIVAMEHPDMSSYRRDFGPDFQPINAGPGKGAGRSQVVSPPPITFARDIFKSALGYAEGGKLAEQAGMNDKEVIVEAVKAIKGMSENPEIALGVFVEKYGEDALRDLVEKVQSGALDDTIARFANGEKGMVEGPGDGSGEDDMVPATLDGEQDVLLTEGEFVIRQPTTEALEEEFGNGFLDVINQAEDDAPEKLKEMVG
jgi:hypothetical protein